MKRRKFVTLLGGAGGRVAAQVDAEIAADRRSRNRLA
jgi:hypothetical protein